MGEIAPDEETLSEMQLYGCKFAAYENTNITHPRRGELKFLRYGYLNNPYAVPPEIFPLEDEDGKRLYKRIGYVNLQTGTIHKSEKGAEIEGNPYGSGEDERFLPPSSSRTVDPLASMLRCPRCGSANVQIETPWPHLHCSDCGLRRFGTRLEQETDPYSSDGAQKHSPVAASTQSSQPPHTEGNG